MTCGDCVEKNRCMERSRNYCCIYFKEQKEGVSNGSRKKFRKQSKKVFERK